MRGNDYDLNLYSLLKVKEASERASTIENRSKLESIFYSFLARERACSFLIYMISRRANEETHSPCCSFSSQHAYVKTGKVERETDNFDLLQ